jgi:hypothetical protein
MTIAKLAAAAMSTRRTVRITTVRGEPERHYVALVVGDQVLTPLGLGPVTEERAEQIAADCAAIYGVDVSARDVDVYDVWEG